MQAYVWAVDAGIGVEVCLVSAKIGTGRCYRHSDRSAILIGFPFQLLQSAPRVASTLQDRASATPGFAFLWDPCSGPSSDSAERQFAEAPTFDRPSTHANDNARAITGAIRRERAAAGEKPRTARFVTTLQKNVPPPQNPSDCSTERLIDRMGGVVDSARRGPRNDEQISTARAYRLQNSDQETAIAFR